MILFLLTASANVTGSVQYEVGDRPSPTPFEVGEIDGAAVGDRDPTAGTRDVKRRYFDGGDERLESAARFVRGRHQDWDAARDAWMDVTYSGSKKLAAMGHYNLALYHERAGNLDAAITSVQLSLGLRRSSLAEALYEDLDARRVQGRDAD